MDGSNESGNDYIKSAVDRLSQAEEISQRFIVINTFSWVASLGLFLIFTIFALWLFFGDVSLSVEGVGIVRQDKNEFVIYGFIPYDQSQNIRPGLSVFIDFSNIHMKKFGQLKGKVTQTSYFRVTEETVSKIIPDVMTREKLLERIAHPVLIEITPLYKPDSMYLDWTGQNPSGAKLIDGSQATIKIILDSITPYTFIYPSEGLHEKE